MASQWPGFWQRPQPIGVALDPVAESERLRDNAEEGAPVTRGATPVIAENILRDHYSVVPNAVSIGCNDSDPLITHNVFYNNISLGGVGIFTGTARILNNTFDRNQRGFWSISTPHHRKQKHGRFS